MKKVNFDVKLPAFVDRIVYVDNYGARPYCYTIEDASRNADAINRAINYISEKGGGNKSGYHSVCERVGRVHNIRQACKVSRPQEAARARFGRRQDLHCIHGGVR